MSTYHEVLQWNKDKTRRIVRSPDMHWSMDDLKGDSFKPWNSTAVLIERLKEEEKQFEDQVELYGVWTFAVEQWNPAPGVGWEVLDSVSGVVGDDDSAGGYMDDLLYLMNHGADSPDAVLSTQPDQYSILYFVRAVEAKVDDSCDYKDSVYDVLTDWFGTDAAEFYYGRVGQSVDTISEVLCNLSEQMAREMMAESEEESEQ